MPIDKALNRGYVLSPLAAPHHRREGLVLCWPSDKGKAVHGPSPGGGRGNNQDDLWAATSPRRWPARPMRPKSPAHRRMLARQRAVQERPTAYAESPRPLRHEGPTDRSAACPPGDRNVADAIVRDASALAIPFVAKHSSDRAGRDDCWWAKAVTPPFGLNCLLRASRSILASTRPCLLDRAEPCRGSARTGTGWASVFV